ncbi:DUF6894 family protein [Mesorhizobium sp. BR1-1-13]|uniref:DUF6894 family protein n=2 Tax=unclassified Mesorhizobium TaxID=325217 RepID=UPI00398D0FEB
MENLAAAQAEAKRAAQEAMLDGIAAGMDPTCWVTKIYDEAGYLVSDDRVSGSGVHASSRWSAGRRRTWCNAVRLREPQPP